MCREQTQRMDVFEQLRWLARDEEGVEITKRVANAAIVIAGDWLEGRGFNESISNFSATLVRIATHHGGEKRAQELKAMMEDSMRL